jgi:molybdopterin-binding protein
MKLTRSQVAEMLQITPRTLAAWEASGRVPKPERDWRGWRFYDEQAIAAIRQAIGGPSASAEPVVVPDAPEQISARNRLRGIVTGIIGDGILCEVVLDLGNGQEIVSVITRSSVERLGLKIGMPAYAVMKSTEVMIAR